jgi:Tim44-like domain
VKGERGPLVTGGVTTRVPWWYPRSLARSLELRLAVSFAAANSARARAIYVARVIYTIDSDLEYALRMRGTRAKLWFAFMCVVAALCVGYSGRALAMSGGEPAEAAGVTSAGKWLVCALLALPLLLYVHIGEALGVLATRRDLGALARARSEFDWRRVEAEVNAAIRSIYAAWNDGDLAPVAGQMSPEYFAWQRETMERWQAEGKRNTSQLGRVRSVRPLWVGTRDATHHDTLALLVRVAHLHYLEDTTTGALVKGSRRPNDSVVTVWLFAFIDDAWRVSGIESQKQAYGFATLTNRVSLDGARRVARAPAATAAGNAAAQPRECAPVQIANAQHR